MKLAENHRAGPLEGVRILDLTRVLSGPYCALLLGELGAEVIKIERPGRGDHSRRTRGGLNDTGLRFLAWNMYRKSITLNLWTSEGASIFRDLAAKADVVLENFRPQVMDSIGLGYETLKTINPAIIMASITGFGQGNSLSQRPAHASVISAFTGIQDMNRGLNNRPAPIVGASPDIAAGVYAAIGILAAICGRHATGQGRHVDISMVDSVVGGLAYELMYTLLTGKVPPEGELRAGDGHSATESGPAFHECYQASDGWFYVQADLPAQWERLTKEIGVPEMVTDPAFLTEADRSRNKEALDAIFSEWLRGRTKEEAFQILGNAGVPCSPAYSLAEVAHHPYLRERGILREVDDPRTGKMFAITPRIRFEGEAELPVVPAPSLGEHNSEVFGELLGLDPQALDALRDKGII